MLDISRHAMRCWRREDEAVVVCGLPCWFATAFLAGVHAQRPQL